MMKMNSHDKDKASDMRRAIRGAVRGLWSGTITMAQFITSMGRAIDVGLTRAWQAGAAEMGIRPDEMSRDEQSQLQNRISSQMGHIVKFGQDIEKGSKANGGKLGRLHKRAEMWSTQYQVTFQEARTMSGGDRKFMWTLGNAEHCGSCLKLNGKVKRGSFWHSRGILPGIPGAPYLECRGFRCPCALVPTDAPMSRGSLPGLP